MPVILDVGGITESQTEVQTSDPPRPLCFFFWENVFLFLLELGVVTRVSKVMQNPFQNTKPENPSINHGNKIL